MKRPNQNRHAFRPSVAEAELESRQVLAAGGVATAALTRQFEMAAARLRGMTQPPALIFAQYLARTTAPAATGQVRAAQAVCRPRTI